MPEYLLASCYTIKFSVLVNLSCVWIYIRPQAVNIVSDLFFLFLFCFFRHKHFLIYFLQVKDTRTKEERKKERNADHMHVHLTCCLEWFEQATPNLAVIYTVYHTSCIHIPTFVGEGKGADVKRTSQLR